MNPTTLATINVFGGGYTSACRPSRPEQTPRPYTRQNDTKAWRPSARGSPTAAKPCNNPGADRSLTGSNRHDAARNHAGAPISTARQSDWCSYLCSRFQCDFGGVDGG